MKKTIIGGLAGLLMTLSAGAGSTETDVKDQMYVGHMSSHTDPKEGEALAVYTRQCGANGYSTKMLVFSDPNVNASLPSGYSDTDLHVWLSKADMGKAIVYVREDQIAEIRACNDECGCESRPDF